MKIALDAGHGRIQQGHRTPRALGRPMLYESSLARQLVKKIDDCLSREGVEVIHTWTKADDSDVVRVRRALGCDVLVSIHTGRESGLWVGTAADSKMSQRLAHAMCMASAWNFPLPLRMVTDTSLLASRGPHSGMRTVVLYIGCLEDKLDVTNLRSQPYLERLSEALSQCLLTAIRSTT